MSSYFYGLNNSYVEETVKNAYDIIKYDQINMNQVKKEWKHISDKFVTKKWIYRYIKDEAQEKQLREWYDILCNDDTTYNDYKKAFKNVANFFGLTAEQIVIEHITFEKGKGAENDRVAIRYSKGLVKIKIPKGLHLIHMSPVSDITNLRPAFRSRTKGKFLYPNKRCYFTVGKAINPFKAGLADNILSPSKVKLTRYTTVNDVTEAYIDPACNTFADGAVMIITDNPIPVVKFDSKMKRIFKSLLKKGDDKESIKEEYEEVIEGSFDYTPEIQELVECMEFDEELIDETSIKEFLGLIKKWHTANDRHLVQKFRSDHVSDEDFEMMKDLLEKIKSAKTLSEYRKPFDEFCKFCNILPNNVIISKYVLKKGHHNKNSISVDYSHNNKPIKLPEGIKLYHFSKVPNITALKPVFKGKSEKGYLYDRPRVYLTINKHMPKLAADYTDPSKKIHKYEVTKNITDVYVDPLVWHISLGAVYVLGNNDIPVKDVTND